MKILISQATLVDNRHPDNGKKKDILILNGKIDQIEDHLETEADERIVADRLCVSIGWLDLRANFRDPGEEYKEGIQNGIEVAKKSGFTAVALSPDTTPATDNKGGIQYLKKQGEGSGVDLIPLGALSVGLEGRAMSEMFDMFQSGARGFSDDKRSISESGLLHRALLYTANFGAPVLHFPYDSNLIPNGQINEGLVSTKLGLKGIPSISEEMVVRRDLTLAEYTNGRLHLGPLSSSGSVDLISDAKKKGLNITCEVSAANLAFNEKKVSDFDTNYKLIPPLRSEENRMKIIDQLMNGEIDVLSSDHSPEDVEHKKLEFDLAEFGIAGMEYFFPLVYGAVGDKMPLSDLVATFTINPRNLLNLEIPLINPGQKANLTLFSTEEYTSIDSFQTKGYNVPRDLKDLRGRVIRTILG